MGVTIFAARGFRNSLDGNPHGQTNQERYPQGAQSMDMFVGGTAVPAA
ncbi:MAG: hypothetical protein NTZ53_09310 [Cyanobacteria bacterium]|nr:hypothetical protein [Cyanobacteriota bacterium]